MSNRSFDTVKECNTPLKLKEKVYKKSIELINPPFAKVATKYSVLFLVSIFFSLVVCPQKGVSFVRESFPVFHHILHQSPILCGVYCALIFFFTTHIISFLLLSHFERISLFKNSKGFLPLIWLSLFFGLSMTPYFSKMQMGYTYDLTWILTAITLVFLHKIFFNKNYLAA